MITTGITRETIARGRVALAALAIGLVVVATWFVIEVGPLRGCRAVIPRELPSGSQPGVGVHGVAAGAMQVIWGTGGDRVEELVGLDLRSPLASVVANVEIRGHPASVYRLREGFEGDVAMSWEESGCSYTVFLAPGTADEEAIDFAARF